MRHKQGMMFNRVVVDTLLDNLAECLEDCYESLMFSAPFRDLDSGSDLKIEMFGEELPRIEDITSDACFGIYDRFNDNFKLLDNVSEEVFTEAEKDQIALGKKLEQLFLDRGNSFCG